MSRKSFRDFYDDGDEWEHEDDDDHKEKKKLIRELRRKKKNERFKHDEERIR